MITNYLKGKEIAKEIKQNVKEKLQTLSFKPKLVSILASQDGGAKYYAKKQKKSFEKIGIDCEILELPDTVSQTELINEIKKLNKDENVHGILLLLPLPQGIDRVQLINYIDPGKDVEGITPANLGKLFYGDFKIAPCTAKAVYLMLEDTKISLAGKEIVVISHSDIVGKPLLPMLLSSLNESPTPVCCHIATKDLRFHTSRADIIICAAGKASLVTGDMIKEGAILIDVGINPVVDKETNKTKIVGDIDEESVKGIASILTPVPGGVGTVTTAVLMQNLANLLVE